MVKFGWGKDRILPNTVSHGLKIMKILFNDVLVLVIESNKEVPKVMLTIFDGDGK